MGDPRRCRLISGLLLVLCLVFATVPSSAIHEDEQGLRDWILRFVGHVEHAAFIHGQSVEKVFVTSSQGAVAALSVDGTSNLSQTMVWRQIFSTPQACVAAGRHGVVVSDPNGAVHLLHSETGTLVTNFKLIVPDGARVTSCLMEKKKILFASLDAATAYLYEVDVSSEDEEIRHSSAVRVGDDARDVRLTQKHVWVFRGSSADRFIRDASSPDVTGLRGELFGVSPSGEAVSGDNAALHVAGKDGRVDATECKKCSAAVMLSDDGAFTGVVSAAASPEGLLVTFPGGKTARVAGAFRNAPPAVLLAVQDADRGPLALLRTGAGHLFLVSATSGTLWERPEGLAETAAAAIVESPHERDHFAFAKIAVAVSRYGIVYVIPVMGMGTGARVLLDLAPRLTQALGATTMTDVTVNRVADAGDYFVSVTASFGSKRVQLSLHIDTGKVQNMQVMEEALLVAPTFDVAQSHEVRGALPAEQQHVFRVNTSAGLLEGFQVAANTTDKRIALPLWSVRMPSAIVAYATGEDEMRTMVINQLRVFPNRSDKELVELVHRKYPTRNIIVVAHYEPAEEELTTLVVTALDTITGSVLGVARHRNVEGKVHILIVEHTVLYYFMDGAKMRHCLGVWEIFEEEAGPVVRKDAGATLPQVIASFFLRTDRKFSSRASRPPVVAASVLGVYGGEVASLAVTTSFGGIARKNVIFAFESGRVAIVELNRLLAGGQMPIDESGKQLTHIIIPSQQLATHKYRIALPRFITTEPTDLESSCHVLVSGLDLFYVRASSGKAFDLLNSDFNKNLLIALTSGFGLLSIVVRYLVVRKGLNLLWK